MGSPAIVTEFRFDTERTFGLMRASPNPDGGFHISFVLTSEKFYPTDLYMASEFFRRLAEASTEKTDGK